MLGGGLYEVRTKVDRNQYRVLFCMLQRAIVLLHGFVKKKRTAPEELALARQRMNDVKTEQAKLRKVKARKKT